MSLSGETASSALAAILIDELVRCGVDQFVYCPGSRNGPLGFQLARRAALQHIDFHVRLDERSAGFLALGMTRGNSRQTAVVTTSGTAVSNLLPAATEAHYSKVGLVFVTANRPLAALGTGASQTVEQNHLLASQLRHICHVADVAGSVEEMNRETRSKVCRTIAKSNGMLASARGPVQIDVSLASGVPPTSFTASYPAGRPGGKPWIEFGGVAPQQILPPTSIDLSRPTIAIAGDGALPDESIPLDLPVIVEPTVSSAHKGRALHPWVLDYVEPEQLIVYGRPTLHRNVGAALARAACSTTVVADPDDEWLYAADHVNAMTTCPAFSGKSPERWLEETARVSSTIQKFWRSEIQSGRLDDTGLGAAATAIHSLKPGDILWLGPSNPVRDAALVGVPPGVKAISNRGVAGIDGNLSGAFGVALTNPDRTVLAIVGDLTFAYDASGLQRGVLEQRLDNLIVVVCNDRGGGIFELLEQGKEQYRDAQAYGNVFERIYGTEQHMELEPLCNAYGIDHALAPDASKLPPLIEAARAAKRCTVVEVSLQRGNLRTLHASARRSISSQLITR